MTAYASAANIAWELAALPIETRLAAAVVDQRGYSNKIDPERYGVNLTLFTVPDFSKTGVSQPSEYLGTSRNIITREKSEYFRWHVS